MATQKFMGRGHLLERLTAQVGNRKLAVEVLQKHGHLMPDGKTYTKEGMKRNMMTAEERAKDREFKRSGTSKDKMIYDASRNKVIKI